MQWVYLAALFPSSLKTNLCLWLLVIGVLVIGKKLPSTNTL